MLFWRRVRSYPNVSRGRQLSSGIRQWRLRNLELSKDGKVVVEKVRWRMILDVTHRQYLSKNSKIRFTVRCTNERWVEDQLANERSKRHGDAVDDQKVIKDVRKMRKEIAYRDARDQQNYVSGINACGSLFRIMATGSKTLTTFVQKWKEMQIKLAILLLSKKKKKKIANSPKMSKSKLYFIDTKYDN